MDSWDAARYTRAMEWITLPARGSRFASPIDILHTVIVLTFVSAMLAWPILAGTIHKFATVQPDASHSYPVSEHGGTFFVTPVLGRLYTRMPWIWGCSLAASVLFTWGRSKGSRR